MNTLKEANSYLVPQKKVYSLDVFIFHPESVKKYGKCGFILLFETRKSAEEHIKVLGLYPDNGDYVDINEINIY